MKDQVKAMFEQVTMPEGAEKKIHAAMAAGRKKRSPQGALRRLAATAAVLALMLAISPEARAAFDRWWVKYFWTDSDITIYEEVDESGEPVATIAAVDTEAPAFARMVNGRLYFLGNGEKIDITEQLREDAPYYYTYMDEYGFTHEMAVAYSGTLENFGIYEFIWKGENGEKTWVTGTGRNFLSSETGTCYPWVEIVWQKLDIPWPMPE